MVLTAARRLGRRSRAGRIAALASVTIVAAGPVGAAAQDSGVVRSARVEVDMRTPADGVAVRVELEVAPGAEGGVPLELLEHPGSTGIEVRRSGGAPVPLRTASGTRRTGTAEARPTAAGESVRLAFEYSVPGAVTEVGARYFARIPVLGVALPPLADGADVFSVVVSTPEGWTVVDGFPSGLRRVVAGRHEASLPVVPSMVGVRGRTDGAWRPGADLAVEVFTVGALLAFLGLGWRRLRARVA